jgi:hypothetical protein
VRAEKNISTKGEKKKTLAWLPQQIFNAGGETRYKKKTGQGQEETDGIKRNEAKE